MEKQILFEDNHLIVVNKKAGELVQGDQTGDVPLAEKIKSFLKKKYNKPGAVFLGVVHRLDRPTSGVVVFAKTSKALSRLNEQFKKRIPKKTYWAIVSNAFPDEKGSLSHWMTRNTKQNKSRAHTKEVLNSKLAKLQFKRIKNFSLLPVRSTFRNGSSSSNQSSIQRTKFSHTRRFKIRCIKK